MYIIYIIHRSIRVWVPKLQGGCKDFRAHTATVRSVYFSPDETKVCIIYYNKNTYY